MRESFVTWDKSGTTIHIPPLPTGAQALFWIAGLLLALLLLGYLLKTWPNVQDRVVKRLERSRIPVPLGIAVAIAFVLLGPVFLGLAVYTILRFFQALLDPASHEAVRNIGFALAAIIGLPFLIWRSVVAQSMATTAQQGLITDRINKAVEGLGSEKTVKVHNNETEKATEETKPNLEVRIGSIYALERIAQDSDRDHIRIMEILCAYIRENAPARDAKDHGLGAWQPLADGATEEDRTAHAEAFTKRFGKRFEPGEIGKWAQALEKPRTDISAALEVIGRRSDPQIAIESAHDQRGSDTGYRLDLRETNPQAADLSQLNLKHAILIDAHLEGANLEGAHLEGASLGAAHLEGATLRAAHLEGADLWAATLRGAALKSVFLRMDSVNLNLLKDAYGDGSVILPDGWKAGEGKLAHWHPDDLDDETFEKNWRAHQAAIGYTPPAD